MVLARARSPPISPSHTGSEHVRSSSSTILQSHPPLFLPSLPQTQKSEFELNLRQASYIRSLHHEIQRDKHVFHHSVSPLEDRQIRQSDSHHFAPFDIILH